MQNMKKFTLGIFLIVAIMCTFTGCKNKTEDTNKANKNTKADSSANLIIVESEEELNGPIVSDEKLNGLLNLVKYSEELSATVNRSSTMVDGILTVSTNAQIPPFAYEDVDGKLQGFDIALMKAIGKKLGVEIEFKNVDFSSVIDSVANGADIAICGITITSERLDKVDFSDPYYQSIQYVIINSSAMIGGVEDLKNSAVGVKNGTIGEYIADGLDIQNVTSYASFGEAVTSLKEKKIEAIIADKIYAIQAENNGSVKAIPGQQFGFYEEPYAIAIPKGDMEMYQALSGALEELKAEGIYNQLLAIYVGE